MALSFLVARVKGETRYIHLFRGENALVPEAKSLSGLHGAHEEDPERLHITCGLEFPTGLGPQGLRLCREMPVEGRAEPGEGPFHFWPYPVHRQAAALL